MKVTPGESGSPVERNRFERRAAACLRACEGIPTSALERDVILRLIAACVHVSDQRVREVLEELLGPSRREAVEPDTAAMGSDPTSNR